MLTTFLLVNAVTFAAVLLTARFDSRLVDDNGMAIQGDWHELVVPQAAPHQDAPVLA